MLCYVMLCNTIQCYVMQYNVISCHVLYYNKENIISGKRPLLSKGGGSSPKFVTCLKKESITLLKQVLNPTESISNFFMYSLECRNVTLGEVRLG